MTSVYAVGGEQRPGAGKGKYEWGHYLRGRILRVDLGSGDVEECVSYTSPPAVCPDEEPSILFKSATLEDGRLYACTTTELLTFELPTFRRVGYVSLPCFNDVHHVRPSPAGGLLVANTGLDMVVEVGPDGRVTREWTVADEAPWTRFSRNVDYRKMHSTKPHRAHPNHVFLFGGEIWATRCDRHDAVCLTADGRIDVGTTLIHDGRVRGDTMYFTQVDGHLVEVEAATRTVRRRIDLNLIAQRGMPLGWCRGLEVLDDDCMVVAFSRLRPTAWQEKLRWLGRWMGGSGLGLLPTRLVVLDLTRRKVLARHNLENFGMHAVFSIHLVPDGA